MSYREFLEEIDSKIERTDAADHGQAVFVLHDQLNMQMWPEWVREQKPLLIFMEARAKGNSLPYHKKKLTYVLSSMRHFAIECSEQGYLVYYHATRDHYDDGLKELLEKYDELQISYMKPSEWETRKMLRDLNNEYSERLTELENTFFLADSEQCSQLAGGGHS